MENNWIHLFGRETLELVRISSGDTAPPVVANDLLTAKQKDEKVYTTFKVCTIEQHACGLFGKIPRQQLRHVLVSNKKYPRRLQTRR